MIRLTTNLSEPLLDLIHRENFLPDGLEVGPWLSLRQIRAYRKTLPDIPFYFHGSDVIEGIGLIPGTVSKIKAYLQVTASPWVSMHISMWLPGMVWLMLRHGWRMPLPDPERATRGFVQKVSRLIRSLDVPVLLENIEPRPFEGYIFESQTARITRVLEETGCGLLLDLGHARISADVLGMDGKDYLAALPLHQVMQIHVSGPRMRAGHLVDSHELLTDADYELLDFVLARTRPQVVTLEYIHERNALREQLSRLRRTLDALPG
jgi:uncharacterized protein (UPF0276 family)